MEQLSIPGLKTRRADAVHATNAEKQAAYRARKNLKPVTIQLPMDLCERLGAHLVKHGKGKSETIAHLIESQLLRKR
jgi:hypothetical protein